MGWIEGRGWGVAVTPFHVVERVQAEMDKSVCFKLLPFQLLPRRDGQASLRTVDAGSEKQGCNDEE